MKFKKVFIKIVRVIISMTHIDNISIDENYFNL